MTIVDTTVWIDYFQGVATLQTEWLAREVDRNRLGLADLTLCEVLQGIRDEAQFRGIRRDLLRFEVYQAGGEQLAVAAAENYRFLRARGITIRKTIDCLIATLCLTKGYSLLHKHRDFDPFETYLGLQVVHPRVS